jgi:hypothetical protein
MKRYILLNLKTIQEYINSFKHPYIYLLIVLALGFILRAYKMVRTGIWVDEGIFLYEVQMILDGKIPYRDFFKVKPLGMIYLLSIPFYFSGHNVIIARTLTSFLGLWTSLIIYLLGKEMYNQKIGFLAATFYTFDPLVILFSYHVYMEPYATFFVVLSAYFAIIGNKKEKIVAYFISGIFIGTSFFMKQPGIIMGLVIASFIFYSNFQEKSIHNGFKEFLTLLIGISIVLILIASYLLSIGLLGDFIYYNLTFHLKYTGSATTLLGRLNVVRQLVLDNILLWVAGFLAIPIFLKNRKDVDIFTLSFFLVTFLALISFLTPYKHYFVQATPPLCILASYFLIAFLKTTTTTKLKFKIINRHILLVSIIVLIGISFFLSARSYASARSNSPSLEEQKLVAEYIKQHTDPDEYIFSSYPAYYFLSERTCPSKYIFLAIATLEVEDVDFPEVLQEKNVRYVILTTQFTSKRHNEKVDLIIDYIETYYQLEKTFSFKEKTFIYSSRFW